MKSLFTLFLVLTLCFAVLCERNIGFQVDALGIAIQNDFAPYIKISQGGNFYYMSLQSIYEIYLDPNTNQWTKDFSTETLLNTLTWNVTVDLKNAYSALLGSPCPCHNSQQGAEPFPVSRSIGRQMRDDPFENAVCGPNNFGYFRLVFQEVINNNTNCVPAQVSMCTQNCNTYCNSSANVTSCNNGCSAINNASVIDTNDCYNACAYNGTTDPNCIGGCMAMVDCLTGLSCRLDIGYHLHKYEWANSTAFPNATRKLVFAFEILPQSSVNSSCGSDFVTWFEGPFFLWLNSSSLAVLHPDGCVECLPDLSAAVAVPSSLFFAPSVSSVIGRIYVDQFTSGFSLFNQPVEMMDNMSDMTSM